MSKIIGRTFKFETALWKKLDADAERCGRSSTKQLEAILKTYYDAEDVELSRHSLEMLGELSPRSRTKMPIIEADVNPKQKKRTA